MNQIKTWRERLKPGIRSTVDPTINELMQAEIDELRQAIEVAEKQEPVAWLVCFDGRIGGARVTDKLVIWRKEQAEQQVRAELIQSVEPLYTRIKS
jgi:hypothetical protein